MAKRLSKEVWERRVNDAGAGRYEFVRWSVDGEFGAGKKCVVRCAKDGFAWESKVNNLVNRGQGCPQCSGKRRWTADERIEQINKLENIEFISLVDPYKNKKSKSNVRCTLDGYEWSVIVSNLVNDERGCPECARRAREITGCNRRLPQESYIERLPREFKFIKWHGKYKGSKGLMILSCVNGHIWKVKASKVIHGTQGCPSCASSGYNPSKTGTLYALRSECGMYVKIGISNDPKRRHSELEKRTPFKFNIVEQFEGGGAKIAELEKYFHGKYERAGFTGFDGCTEWLACTPQLLKELRELEDVK